MLGGIKSCLIGQSKFVPVFSSSRPTLSVIAIFENERTLATLVIYAPIRVHLAGFVEFGLSLYLIFVVV